MKKLIFGCVALAATLALASTVQSSNVFGVLKVDNTDEQVIICVPWGTVGTGAAISPADLVCTTGLQTGDTLYWYNSQDKKYYGWKISNGSWVGDKIVEGDDAYIAGNAQTVARGTDALILTRPGTRSAFYLNGQYVSASSSAPMTANEMTFFAPPTAEPVNLNEVSHTGSYAHGDRIRFGIGKEFYYVSGKDGLQAGWYYDKPTQATTPWGSTSTINIQTREAILPAGVAGIYISNGGNPTFSW